MFTLKKHTSFLVVYIILILSTASAKAESIDFDYVMKKAVENSFDLKISNVDIDISKAVIKETKSLYYPTFKTQMYSEYSRDLTDGFQTLSSVGSSVVNTNTKYQDLLNLSLSYNVYDFGVRGRRLSIAKKDMDSKKNIHSQNMRELKLKIVDLYTNALLTYKELNSKETILPIHQELFDLKGQLYNAGTASKIELADEAIKMARTSNEINILNTRLKVLLKDLSYYTQEKYDPDTLQITDFPEIEETYVSNVNLEKKSGQTYELSAVKRQANIEVNEMEIEKTPDFKIYQLEIEKKQAELQILKRERLPAIGIYSSYSLYGSDSNNILDSVSDIQDRSLSFGFSTTITPFDGFKTSANIKKLELEIERLKLARDQKLAELKNKYEKINEEALYYDGQTETEETLLARIQERLVMLEKLTEQKLIDKPTLLSQKTDLIKQKTELEKALINKISAIKKLNIYAETYLQ